ncbi:MAG: carboxylating nicotinate-nucleotide diphosphorylase [Chloroflexota bacterium]|nr:carboxylating nicotinate-nucleotide diphosphorylase [Chloroflexota bacterium]
MDEALYRHWRQVEEVIDAALAEDAVSRDVTTQALVPPHLEGRARIQAKADGVLAGIDVARQVFARVDPSLRFQAMAADGSRVARGDVVATIGGSTASILTAERTALNFLCHMSGIATETARYVEAVRGCRARMTDTRKTTPGIRPLEKYAVRAGGGESHREDLGAMVLIKDNHLAALKRQGLGIGDAVARARAHADVRVEVEVESIAQAEEALSAGADIIMLDNMSLAEMRRAVALAAGRCLVEASGGVTLASVRAVAETGVDLISVGALTHSAPALDLGLELE